MQEEDPGARRKECRGGGQEEGVRPQYHDNDNIHVTATTHIHVIGYTVCSTECDMYL